MIERGDQGDVGCRHGVLPSVNMESFFERPAWEEAAGARRGILLDYRRIRDVHAVASAPWRVAARVQ